MRTRVPHLICLPLLFGSVASAEIQVVTDVNLDGRSSFEFARVPRPSAGDAAESGQIEILSGERDRNGGGTGALNDGRLPRSEDQPSGNFFFAAGSAGGRLLLVLDQETQIKQINTYSWHPNDRGPQVYTLYASSGQADGFQVRPAAEVNPGETGWKRVARVDTRAAGGGQHGVSLQVAEGLLGTYRYLLFEVERTEDNNPFGNTFYSEIDVISKDGNAVAVSGDTPVETGRRQTVEAGEGKYQIEIDTSETPDLEDWVNAAIIPMTKEWYPKLVEMLSSDGYEAPTRFSIVFSESMRGVAATGGRRIRCSATWMRRNVDGEALGAVFHELVHVVQQYGRARRSNPNATRTPGWLVEGIPDYIRWFLFEPETKGAEITARNIDRARYDASYRISANFLNWVVQQYGPDVISKLNAAARQGAYQEELWKELTGHSVEELGEEWRRAHLDRLQSASE